ncbi:MAG: single-stranded-DNA-specific exonuclease RecJ [Christensenellales bacterium]
MIFKSIPNFNGVNEIKDFAQRHSLCFKTSQILMQRGIDTDQKLHSFLHPSLQDLRNPFLLQGMKECHDRLQQAIDKNQSVLIYGDYDVDGISAVTILYKFLKDKITNLNYFLPNRYVDGYGLTTDSAKKVIEKFKPELIITVDCGISCANEVDFVKSQNIDIIITDHHEPAEVLPNTVVVDPKLPNQNYGFNGLCGAGVALKVVQSFVGNNGLSEYLPICAIATVSDIVPLVDENRSIVKLGLDLQKNLPIGIKKLAKNLKINTINSQAISFKIAPRLNAGGRMGNAYTALDLFISDDSNLVSNSLKTLLEQNAQRQMLSQSIYTECLQQIKENKLFENKAIILKSDKWDSGLLGIACARLVDDFCKPVFLFSQVDDQLKGSVRSFGNINIHTLLTCCSEILDTFGGHSMAAGLGLHVSNYESFISLVFDYLNNNTTKEDYLPIKSYDVEINAEDITLKFAKELELLEPFGCDNPMPQFLITYEDCKVTKLANFNEHLSIVANNELKLIHFNSAEYFDDYLYTKQKQSIFEMQINEFKGKEYVKGLVKYSNFAGINQKFQHVANGRKLKQLYNEKDTQKDIKFFKQSQTKDVLNNLLQDICGTAIIIDNYKTFDLLKDVLKYYNLNYYVGASQSKFAENCVIFALDEILDLSNYKNLVFLDGLLTRSFLQNFEGNVYAVSDAIYELEYLNTEHSYFGLVFNAIKGIIKNNIAYASELDLFKNIKELYPNLKNMSYSQFVFCLYVFFEIGVLKKSTQFGYVVEIDEQMKSSLENSNLYNKIRLVQKIK